MLKTSHSAITKLFNTTTIFLLVLTTALSATADVADAELRSKLKKCAHKIVYETFRHNNWELFMIDADGADPVNLTNTPNVGEMYPHVSPDGAKISFVADEGKGPSKVRNLYYMNIDGTGRTKVADNARQQCWSPDGTAIAYLKGEFKEFCYKDYATKGIFIYDLKTGKHRRHPNRELYHLYNICWSPDGNWFLATVHGGMGYKHAILAIEANGTRVFNLDIPGCRPDISPDGKKVAWGSSDWVLRVGDLDLTSPEPKVANQRDVVTSAKPMKIYHIDWSPDGKYVAFSRGPTKKKLGEAAEIVGMRAEGWNICVADASATNKCVAITTDGKCNKEPDWLPIGGKKTRVGGRKDSSKNVRQIVFSSNRSGPWRIWIMNADGSEMRQLTKGRGDAHDVDPVFSPDGKAILFSSTRGGKIGVWRMSDDGSKLERICDGDQAEWSHDGKKIALRRNGKLFTRDLTRGKEERITPEGWTLCSGPSWSPDGKTIAFACQGEAGNAVFIVGADGGKPLKVYDEQGACEPHWSPDGKLLVYETGTHICTIRPDGKKNRLITYYGGVQRYGRWSPDGKHIVFCQGVSQKGPWELYIVSSKGGTPVRLTEGGSDMYPDWK